MRHPTWIPVLALGLFVSSVNAQPSVTCPAPPPGLVNWWTFDEDGAPSRDRAASPNNAQWKGTPVAEERPGIKPSRALCFKTADLVTVPDHDELDLGAEDFTLAFWIRTKESPTIAEKRVKIDPKTYRGYVLFLHQAALRCRWLTAATTTTSPR